MNDASTSASELSEPGNTHLGSDEVLERLDALPPEEKRKLGLIEHRRRLGTDFQKGQLYQEAVCQAILGERRCPRGTAFVAFLAQSMRSIASHRRAKLAKQASMTIEDRSGKSVDRPIAAQQLDPEQTLIELESPEVVDEIYKLMEGDDEAQLMILAIVEGKKGKELRDDLGVDQAGFDYIMKRIRRAAAKKYPNGWPS